MCCLSQRISCSSPHAFPRIAALMFQWKIFSALLMAFLVSSTLADDSKTVPAHEYDLVIYGGTSAGLAAAVQAKRMGLNSVVIEPTDRVGGLTTGGLGQTDIGNKAAIGGIAREFYQDIAKHYQSKQAWKWQRPDEYKSGGQSRTAQGEDAMWTFEPSAALKVYQTWIDDNQLNVVYNQRLNRTSGVAMTRQLPGRIIAITMESGQTYHGRMFIDATYEGDLLAAAGVSYTVGREANSQYGETLNGVQTQMAKHHQLKPGIDPYVVPGDATSGLLPHIDPEGPGEEGSKDHRVQAYCFRMCLTDHPPNRIEFKKPAGYRSEWYELMLRNFEAGERGMPWINSPMPNRKTDTNNRAGFSTDFIGQNYNYPDATYDERAKIVARHLLYQQGLMWTLAHHPRVPESMRENIARWGMCKDEFTDGKGWQNQLYIREARRMVGEYVMTQKNCQGQAVHDPVGLAAYTMDSHNQQRYVDANGHVRNEGDVQVGGFPPYGISYRSIIPKQNEASNLLVPVCLSASHIAFGSIRMEPVFMVLGQSAATAAGLAIEDRTPVHKVDYEKLSNRLLADKQVLSHVGPKPKPGLTIKDLPGVIVDNRQAETQGEWWTSSSSQPRVGDDYLHDGDSNKGGCSATFRGKLPKPGTYRVRMYWAPFSNRATNVNVEVIDAAGERHKVVLNQRDKSSGGSQVLGEFEFAESGTVKISNGGSDGHVIADAIGFEPIEKRRLSATRKAHQDAPNILLIFADDLGFETLGCYGSTEFETPNLDQLAAQGKRFTRAYTSPVCTPSRMSLYTGQYAIRHGYDRVLPVHLGTRQAVDFRDRFVTIGQLLRNAGYATSVTGKWQLATMEFHPNHCRDAGFDSWCIWQIWNQGHKTTRYWNPALNHDGQLRDDISDRYGPDVLADYVIDQMKSAVAEHRPFYIHHNMVLPHIPVLQTAEDRHRNREPSLKNTISYMDQLVGRLVSTVDKLGIAENTYIIFMGDNGTDRAEPRRTKYGLVHGQKRDMNEGGTHIPLIIRRPGTVTAGTEETGLIDMADWLPTLCHLTKTKLPTDIPVDGISFAESVTQNTSPRREFVTASYSGAHSVFDGKTRLTVTSDGTMNTNTMSDRPAKKQDAEKLERLLNDLIR